MPQMEWIWLAALIVFAVLEAATSALVSLWFIGGAFAAMVTALCGGGIWLQTLLFFAVSAVLLMLLRPVARRYLSPQRSQTNAQGNIGRLAIVTEDIDNLRGQGAVKIGGVEWSARSQEDQPIEAGTVVRVLAIEGAKVCVERAEEREKL